jgi:hypothetical protein
MNTTQIGALVVHGGVTESRPPTVHRTTRDAGAAGITTEREQER